MRKVNTSFTCDPNTLDRLRQSAEAEQRSTSAMLNILLREALDARDRRGASPEEREITDTILDLTA